MQEHPGSQQPLQPDESREIPGVGKPGQQQSAAQETNPYRRSQSAWQQTRPTPPQSRGRQGNQPAQDDAEHQAAYPNYQPPGPVEPPSWQRNQYNPASKPSMDPSAGRYLARGLRNLLETVAPAIIIALVINLFLAQATRVYGQSMEPNLHSNQRLVVEKLSYNKWLNVRTPQRGDVVVLRVEGSADLLIKRVIGLPGDRVEVRHGQILINGNILAEPYVVQPTTGDFGPVDVAPLHVFVLGDNRNFSNDSRSFGAVPIKNVVGRAWFSYWPPDEWGPVR